MVRGPGPSPEAEETPPFPQALAVGAQNPIRTPALEPVLKDLTLWDEKSDQMLQSVSPLRPPPRWGNGTGSTGSE